jgi:hypothetical protein
VSRWQLGDITIARVVEFERPVFEAPALFPDAAGDVVAAHRPWLEPQLRDPATGLLVLAFHTFVIRTPRRTILVDTCSGNDKPQPGKPRYHRNRWPYLERLAAAGVTPEQVDVVVCTHLHVDHVAWNTRLVEGTWVPRFPRAQYLFAAAEWECSARSPTGRAGSASIRPPSRCTRRAFLARHADTDVLVMPAHFPTPSAGRIVRHGSSFRFVFDAGGAG